MKPYFGTLSVHVLCDSAMTSLKGRKGEMRHKGLMALQELSSLLRQWCAAGAREGSQARHKACMARPGFDCTDLPFKMWHYSQKGKQLQRERPATKAWLASARTACLGSDKWIDVHCLSLHEEEDSDTAGIAGNEILELQDCKRASGKNWGN